MEPRVQYTTTPDGVRIAYSTMGSGPPVMHLVGFPFSHLLEELTVPTFRRYYDGIAAHSTLIRLNFRGSGMSQRDNVTLDEGSQRQDILAVLDTLNITQANMIGYGPGGMAAFDFAAHYPERVRALVLWDTSPYSYVDSGDNQFKAVMTLLEHDWDTFVRTASSVVFGWESTEDTTRMADMLRGCVDPLFLRNSLAHFAQDATRERQRALLRSVRARTLVLQHERAFSPTVEVAQEVTALLGDASLIMLDGTWITTNERADRASSVILEFFELGPGQAPSHARPASYVTTVLFTDIVGHTEMMSRLGDAHGRQILREHERITREILSQHGGTEVKSMGDGFMASFSSVASAIDCGIALQRAFSGGGDIAIRVGLNAGEPIAEDGDLFGAAVILASRICGRAGAGEILIPEPVRHLLAGKSYTYTDRGEFIPKGFDDAVRLFQVRWQD